MISRGNNGTDITTAVAAVLLGECPARWLLRFGVPGGRRGRRVTNRRGATSFRFASPGHAHVTQGWTDIRWRLAQVLERKLS